MNMRTMRMGWLLIVVTLLSGLLGSTGVLAQSGAQVTGTLTYLPRIALPDDAVVNVQLQEVSRADAPATVLAEQEFVTEGERKCRCRLPLIMTPQGLRSN